MSPENMGGIAACMIGLFIALGMIFSMLRAGYHSDNYDAIGFVFWAMLTGVLPVLGTYIGVRWILWMWG